jgi:hypothetical protein
MNVPLVNKIADALLYEGYMLYPYRPSSKKNRQRFTFGRVYPHAYSVAQKGAEPSAMRTECLATSEGEHAGIEIRIRFLQVIAREVLELREPLLDLPENVENTSLKVVSELQVGERYYSTWQEAIAHEVDLPAKDLDQICDAHCRVPFSFPSSSSLEAIRNDQGSIVGLIRRRGETLVGAIELAAERLDSRAIKIAAAIENHSPISDCDLESQDAVCEPLPPLTRYSIWREQNLFLCWILHRHLTNSPDRAKIKGPGRYS